MNLSIRYDEEPLVALKLYDLDQQNFHNLLTNLMYPTPGIVDRGTVNSKSVSVLAIKSAGLIYARVSPSRQVRWFETAMKRIKMVMYAQSESLEENKDNFCQILCLLVEAMVSGADVSAATREVNRQKGHVEDCAKEYRVRLLITICFKRSTVGDTTDVTLECHKQMSQLLAFPVELVTSFLHLGNFYHLAGYTNQAIACYVNSEKQESQGSHYESPLEWSEHTVSMLDTYKENDKASVAKWREWIESSFQLMFDKFEPSPQQAEKLLDLGIALYDASMNVVALKVMLRTLEIQMKVFGENHSQVVASLRIIGHIYFKDDNCTSALQFYNRSLSVSKRVHGPDSLSTARLLHRIGKVLVYLGRSDAIDYLKQALEILSQLKGDEIEEIETLIEIGLWYRQGLYLYTAFDYYNRAYRIAREHNKEKHVVRSVAETISATDTGTALQTSDSSVSTITSMLQFILEHSTVAIELSDKLSKLFSASHDDEIIRAAYVTYYGYFFSLTILFAAVLVKLLLLVYLTWLMPA